MTLASTPSQPLFHLPGYTVVEQLYQGSRTVVYRATQLAHQRSVAIKVLRREYPSFSELMLFRNQYTIMRCIADAQHLPRTGIVHPLSLEPCGSGYALVMEDFGGVSLGEYIRQRSLELTEVLEVAIQIAAILHDLSQHRVIHKDIKPANILIHPDSQQIKLIDFSIASLLPKEIQEIQSPNILEGTLSYLAPEQTGRMNRGVDYRADFYALGVTLYQLLSGKLPFESSDPLELVHCHIAKLPMPVNQVNSDVPATVSAIVAKLMAKNAEDRYQSAIGLKHDLEQCLTQWRESGVITAFPLGQHDFSDRFLIPEKLYGRETEVQRLLAAFERVANGSVELMLVAGFSGIGKTAVVNEVHKPIVRQRGYFIKGKFDQFNRNIPLSAFVQALRDLMGQLLCESDQQLAQWKSQILAAVGENGQVLIEVIPELEQIIGKQPAVPELSGGAAQNRFNLLFQKFIEVFTTPEHPLVIFLDDLQWADSASLQLMKLLMNDNGYLLILGAYRDNEVSLVHPFVLTVEELKKTKAIVNTITLSPLIVQDINHLLADTLNCSLDCAQPLTELIDHKTNGNPFFIIQFLKALHGENYITFSQECRCWECDMVQLTALALTDDVVEFMAQQLQKLPPETQQVLKLAACVGNQFDLATLAIVAEQSPIQTAALLWSALQEGLILPTSQVYKFFQSNRQPSSPEPFEAQKGINPAYRFLHDRVQQAAYSLIPDDRKQATHIQIGQLLLRDLSETEKEARLLDVVAHLNAGATLLAEASEKYELAQLNLLAGRRARSSSAFAGALSHAATGIQLLANDCWQNQYHLAYSLHEAAAEVAYLVGNFEQMQQWIDVVLQEARTLLDQVKIYRLKIQYLIAQNQMAAAVELGLQVLGKLGFSLEEQQQQISQDLSLPRLEALETAPEMVDPICCAIMHLLADMLSPAYFAVPDVFEQLPITMIKLSIDQGHSSTSASGYGFGALLLLRLEDFDRGYHAGLSSLKLLDRFDSREIKCQLLLIFNVFIRPHKEHGRNSLQSFLEGFQTGLETGDVEYASYCAMNYCNHLLFVGEPLEVVKQLQSPYLEAIAKLKLSFSISFSQIWSQVVFNLLHLSEDPAVLQGEALDETAMLPHLKAANSLTLLFSAYVAKTMLSYWFGDYAEAVENALAARQYINSEFAPLMCGLHYFYYSLAILAQPISTTNERNFLSTVEENQKTMRLWAIHAPMNFQHKYELVEAERHRVLSEHYKALELYDCAIASARVSGYLQEEALANELAAIFYLNWGKRKIAQDYLTNAYYCYARWGAKAKVQDLERRYPQLLAPVLAQQQMSLSATETVFAVQALETCHTASTQSSTISSSISTTLDLMSVLKASQALSSEMQLDKLLATLLQTVLENAGADKGVLLLPHEQQWCVEAVAKLDCPPQIQAIPVTSSQEVPQVLINIVKRNLQPVVIMNVAIHPTLATDPYYSQQHPKSVLCAPILQQGKLAAILYLENYSNVGAFTRDRIDLLNVLCAQAAISLDNARLYTYAQNNQRQLTTLLSNLPGMAYSCANDKDWTMKFVSEGCLSLTGYRSEEILNNYSISYAALIHPEDGEAVDQAVQKALAEHRSFQTSYRIQTQQGEEKWVWEQGQGVFDSKGDLLSIEGFITDVSDRKAAEAIIIQKSQALEQALQDLQNAQLQTIQSEKMASLGNLVTGVAHEINNPIGFLSGSIDNAKDYVKDLLQHLKLYQQHYPDPTPTIQTDAENIDLEFLSHDLPKLLSSMQGATDRIRSISTSLRTFSRADTECKISANLHEGIDSTLMILKYRLKANEHRPTIEVIQNYGDLPAVDCFPGQLNQVFMNILANAIDMFDEIAQSQSLEQLTANPQQIAIRTEQIADQVLIGIRDNGKGMSEEVQSKVFDHLFTTKNVGKGTGLGLTIARQIIVEKHGGSLEVCSELGEGTEFVIRLPLHG